MPLAWTGMAIVSWTPLSVHLFGKIIWGIPQNFENPTRGPFY